MKTNISANFIAIIVSVAACWLASAGCTFDENKNTISDRSDKIGQRSEVVFWHFWGGQDRDVVESVVERFNESQNQYFVRAVAMPGNNLQAKLFLAVAGGDPPDLINQDDPILADWATRGVIQSLDTIAAPREVASVRKWMLPAAQRLSVFDERMFGVCNGLDIRALYYNQTALAQKGLLPPKSIADLDAISNALSPTPEALAANEKIHSFGYLPDSRRLWAWGIVFGGEFLDADHNVTLDSPPIVAALQWMVSYTRRFGTDRIASFRQGDQSLPGKTFPLLPVVKNDLIGRYAMLMDGQWRVRDIIEFQQKRSAAGEEPIEFGVCPLPIPAAAPMTTGSSNTVRDPKHNFAPRENAGWVNGNFFVVPRGAKNGDGAWEFMKFWIGFTNPREAAKTCAAGGWIPVSQTVIDDSTFQDFLKERPLFGTFVELAGSPNQFPIPQVRGAAMFKRTVEDAAYEAMTNPEKSVEEILSAAGKRVQLQLDRLK